MFTSKQINREKNMSSAVDSVFLVSGGLDSFICWYIYSGSKSIPVFVDYGQDYVDQELRAASELYGDSLQTIFIDSSSAPKNKDEEELNPFIPARNLFLASLVAMKYSPNKIYMAGLKDDVVVDKNPEAFREMSKIISRFSKKEIEVVSPFWDKTKGDIIEMYLLRHGGPVSKLLKCHSCYREEEDHCGDCPACFRRYVALKSCGIDVTPEPTMRIINEYLSKLHTYDSNRINRTIQSIKSFFRSVVVVDLDGVYTVDTAGHDYRNRIPSQEGIETFNKKFNDGNLIIIYTSRYESDREVTTRWLKENNILYHSLLMDKPSADYYWDDKAIWYSATVLASTWRDDRHHEKTTTKSRSPRGEIT